MSAGGAHRFWRGAALLGACASLSCSTHVLVGAEHDAGSGNEPRHDAASSSDGAPGRITCGSVTCDSTDVGGGFGITEPCCYNVTKCGAHFSNVCVELDSPGVADPACPAAGTYPGCCRPEGACGIQVTGTAFGCVNPFVFFPTTVLGRCAYPQ